MTAQQPEADFPLEVTAGDRLRVVRRKMDLTQKALAGLIEVNEQTLAAWEVGRSLPSLTPNVAKRLELAYGVPGTAAFVLDITVGPAHPGGRLPHLDLNQEPAGYRPRRRGLQLVTSGQPLARAV